MLYNLIGDGRNWGCFTSYAGALKFAYQRHLSDWEVRKV